MSNPEPAVNSDPGNHPNIEDILRRRREMLSRVRADLEKVGRLQQEFWLEEQKRQAERQPGK